MLLLEFVATLFERETILARWYRAQCEHAHISVKPTLFHFAYTRELFFARCATVLQTHAGTSIQPSRATLFAATCAGHASSYLGTQALLKSALSKEEHFLRELETWLAAVQQASELSAPQHQPFLELLHEARRDAQSRIAQIELLARRLL